MGRLSAAIAGATGYSAAKVIEPFTGAYVTADELNRVRLSAAQHARQRSFTKASQSGLRSTKLRGRGVDFAEVRGYQPGDDIRNIDWRVTARKNAPHTKVFREERERPTLVIVDQSHSLFFGSQRRLKSVAAAEAAAVAAWHALAQHDRVGGFVVDQHEGQMHPPKHSATAVARFMNAIAIANNALNRQCKRSTPQALAEQLQRARRGVRSNYRIYVISDFLPNNSFWIDSLRGMARHNSVSALRLFDPLERELPQDDVYSVTDGSQRQRFDGSSRALRENYQQRFDDWESQLRTQLSGAGIRYASVATNAQDLSTETWL